jgi:mannose-1-phosphate guanylyltransferase
MKAMILAAGFGTRLRPLTETAPKPLLPVGRHPMILWNLLLLRAYGIQDVMINLHYLGHMIRKALGDGSRWNMRIQYSQETEILGTGGALKAVEPFFNGQPFLIMNGDTLIDLDIGDLMRCHALHQGPATLVLREDPDVQQWGVVECDERGRILRINGKGMKNQGDQSSVASTVRRMFAGVHILDPVLLRDEPSGVPFSIIDTYTKALAAGCPIFGYLYSGFWSDVGTLERYARVRQDAETGVFPLALKFESGYS